MVFSSLIFLWFFLPFVLITSRFLKIDAQNALLLTASLFFYSWGEPIYIFLMLFSITANWLFGKLIGKFSGGTAKKMSAALGVIFNLAILGYFKYFGFALEILSKALPIDLTKAASVALPIGISFYTFQSISYLIDVYKGKCEAQNSWVKLSLYISFFPQLIAGPIVKYSTVNQQLSKRSITADKTAYGIKRFVYGLSKKIILSNYFAKVVDEIYGLQAADISTGLAWLAALLYALQIYYDFSGYSDMAVGLGKMFGFDFPENFNYPYISKSIQEFWRRWHISLSNWFKEYLYIPLGGNRKGTIRTYINLLTVFFATGLWHGASWQFVAWGLFNGAFIIAERLFLHKILEKNIPILRNVYSGIVILVSFVIFRAPGLRYSLKLIKNMFTAYSGNLAYSAARYIDLKLIIFTIIGVLLCGFIQNLFPKLNRAVFSEKISVTEVFYIIFLLCVCTVSLISNTYNPFIYFRF